MIVIFTIVEDKVGATINKSAKMNLHATYCWGWGFLGGKEQFCVNSLQNINVF